MTVEFECLDCYQSNVVHAGEENYKEFKIYKFTSFSEAHKHLIENPDHYVDIIIRNEEEE